METRTTADLINEFDAEKEKFFFVALVIGFDRSTSLVAANEGTTTDRLKKLNQLVASGGEPIGLVGFVKLDEHSGTFYTRLVEEFVGTTWAEDYLGRLMESVALSVGMDIGHIQRQKGWMN